MTDRLVPLHDQCNNKMLLYSKVTCANTILAYISPVQILLSDLSQQQQQQQHVFFTCRKRTQTPAINSLKLYVL